MRASKKKRGNSEKKDLTISNRPLKKHPCPDCSFCQMCNDEKCALCRPSYQKDRKKRKRRKHTPLFFRY